MKKDYISRQAALDALALYEKYEGHNYSLFVDVVSECGEVIRHVPSANDEIEDLIEDAYMHGETAAESRYYDKLDEVSKIIRCKDCKYYEPETEWCNEWCHAWPGNTTADEFCSYAEKNNEQLD